MEAPGRLGIADDTIVCFSSDHGDHLRVAAAMVGIAL